MKKSERPMTQPQQQLIAKWREKAENFSEYAGDYAQLIRECANELEATLSAGAVPQQEPQESICMFCDGCGWCEGSPAFTCPRCKGSGHQ